MTYVRPSATSIREFLRDVDADQPPAVPTEAPAPKRIVTCGWCDSTHIADVTCTCSKPCAKGWCPAGLEVAP